MRRSNGTVAVPEFPGRGVSHAVSQTASQHARRQEEALPGIRQAGLLPGLAEGRAAWTAGDRQCRLDLGKVVTTRASSRTWPSASG
jgi:hypothetical protein